MPDSSSEIDQYIYCPRCAHCLSLKTIDNEPRKICENCGFTFWNNPKPAVSMFLYKDHHVLLLQRAKDPFKGYWVLPGGFIGYSETSQEAIQREVKEETDLDVIVEQPVGVYRIDNDPRGVHIDIIFAAETNSNPQLSDEHTDWKYFSKNNLPDNIAYKHREAIEDWYNKYI